MHVIVPAGPEDALALARVHVTSWRETYRGLPPDSILDRMSVPVNTRRFSKSLGTPAEHEITLAAADRDGIVGYAAGGPSRTRLAGEAEVTTLYVLRQHQGCDLGRRLLTAAARVFADRARSP